MRVTANASLSSLVLFKRGPGAISARSPPSSPPSWPHEVAHALQRVERHSEAGIMRAYWTVNDYARMSVRPLPFAQKDVDLIRQRMAARANTCMLTQ